MNAFLFLLATHTAHAQNIDAPVQICLKIETLFTKDEAVGDFWTDNSVPKKGRGLHIRITDEATSRDLVLGRDGCLDTTVHVDATTQGFQLQAGSRSTVNGVEIHATEDSAFDTPSGFVLIDETPPSIPPTLVAWNVDATTGYVERIIPDAQVWRALAVGTWIFHRSTFHLDQGPSRACCAADDPGLLTDGTCMGASPELLTPVTGPLLVFTGPPPSTSSHFSYCGKSAVDGEAVVFVSPTGDIEPNEPDPLPANWSQWEKVQTRPVVQVQCGRKTVLAHEYGHVIAATRLGIRESRNKDAPIDGCVGNYRPGIGGTYLPGDTGGAQSRGNFTKEYLSEAFKEGWADFVGVWAWNRRTDSDCYYMNTSKEYDFDIDGTMDTVAGHNKIDCIGFPDPSSNPAGGEDNWLAYAMDQGFGPGWTLIDVCREDASDNDGNRSTVYDVAKMFWSFVERAVDPYPPEAMADLYVDACPPTWAARDTCGGMVAPPSPQLELSFPYHRLHESMTFHNMSAADHAQADDHIHQGNLSCQ